MILALHRTKLVRKYAMTVTRLVTTRFSHLASRNLFVGQGRWVNHVTTLTIFEAFDYTLLPIVQRKCVSMRWPTSNRWHQDLVIILWEACVFRVQGSIEIHIEPTFSKLSSHKHIVLCRVSLWVGNGWRSSADNRIYRHALRNSLCGRGRWGPRQDGKKKKAPQFRGFQMEFASHCTR